MSEEIEYPSKERERAKVNVKVSAEVNTYLHDLYNQIQYEFCEQYEDYIKDLQQKVEQQENEINRLNNIINELEKWCNECIDNHIIARENGYTTISDTFFEMVLDKLKTLKENNNV